MLRNADSRTFLLVASFPDSLLQFRGALLVALRNRGVGVHVAVPDVPHGSPVRLALEALGVTVHEIPLARTGMNPASDLKLILGLYRLIRRVRPELMLGYTIKPVIYGTLAGRLARVPQRYVLITGLGYAFTGMQAGIVKSMVGWLYRLALSSSDKVFFQNPDDQLLFYRRKILNRKKPSVIVNGSGVDISEYGEQAVRDGPITFLMISRLLISKGVREYAQAAERIRVRYPSVRFFLAGWLDENPDSIKPVELEAWVSSGVIEFFGKLDDVRAAISESSVYVLPSYREGTPRTVLEAMAVGRAIITTDAPGCRETVLNGENGFLVPVQSVEALVEAMLKFVADPALARRMGRRSREIVEERYDVHKVNAVMLREMEVAEASSASAGGV